MSRVQGANYDLEDMRESLEDLRFALEIDPFNPFTHEKYESLNKEYKITEFKERVAYGKMFHDEVPAPPPRQLEGSGNVNGGTGGTGVEGPVVVIEPGDDTKTQQINTQKEIVVDMQEKLPEI